MSEVVKHGGRGEFGPVTCPSAQSEGVCSCSTIAHKHRVVEREWETSRNKRDFTGLLHFMVSRGYAMLKKKQQKHVDVDCRRDWRRQQR